MTSSSSDAAAGLQAYIVGGAVRDELLGLPAGDRDWVVVGATPEQMTQRGFIPVGGDFPVFLHPRSKEEYALARTERKSGRGYRGFTFYTGADVTLEEDLCRRDLTINAIARRPDGSLVDPLGGQADIKARLLRHVGPAFVEDPVRLLRLARFAARFDDFGVAAETMALARRLVEEGEVDALVPERVWKEIAKGLMTDHPARMFDVLAEAGALPRVLPGLTFDSAKLSSELACAAAKKLGLPARFALLSRLSEQPVDVARHLRAPTDCMDHARLLPAMVQALDRIAAKADTGPVTGDYALQEQWLDLMERCDAMRKPARFLAMLEATACVRQVDLQVWQLRLDAVRNLDAGAIARSTAGKPEQIRQALRDARLAALAALD